MVCKNPHEIKLCSCKSSFLDNTVLWDSSYSQLTRSQKGKKVIKNNEYFHNHLLQGLFHLNYHWHSDLTQKYNYSKIIPTKFPLKSNSFQ